MNSGTPHMFSLYPKKLSYSSRNAYIKKIRVRPLGKPTRLLKNLKNAYKLTSFFVMCRPSPVSTFQEGSQATLSTCLTCKYNVFCFCSPAPRCRDSDFGIYVDEWMLPRCYGIDHSEKGLLITKTLVRFYAFLSF